MDEIAVNYPYKDVLAFEGLRKSSMIFKLLELLALQAGSEVSTRELAQNLGISHLTVKRFIAILEQSFIVKVLRSFSRNLRKEISKSFKVYFYDLGIRNSLISNFNQPVPRSDSGALWENFCVKELIKRNAYSKKRAGFYFWRTYDWQEIDLVEDFNGRLFAYEFKFKKNQTRALRVFETTYPYFDFITVNKGNF